MAVDTREKRASVVNLITPLPLPDGAVDEGDRGQVSWVYCGLVVVAERRDLTITVGPLARTRTVGAARHGWSAGPLRHDRHAAALRK